MKFYFQGKSVLTKSRGAGSYGYFGFTWRDTLALVTYFIGPIFFQLIAAVLYFIVNMKEFQTNQSALLEGMLQDQLILFGPFIPVAIILIVLFYKELKQDVKDFWREKWKILGKTFLIWLGGILFITGYSLIIEGVFGANGGGTSENQALLEKALGQNVIFFALFVVVVGPFIEEIIFRKVLLTHFGNSTNYILSGIISTSLFALIHVGAELLNGQWFDFFTVLPVYLAISLVVTLSNYWNRSFVGGYIAHMIHNGMSVLFMILAFFVK